MALDAPATFLDLHDVLDAVGPRSRAVVVEFATLRVFGIAA